MKVRVFHLAPILKRRIRHGLFVIIIMKNFEEKKFIENKDELLNLIKSYGNIK